MSKNSNTGTYLQQDHMLTLLQPSCAGCGNDIFFHGDAKDVFITAAIIGGETRTPRYYHSPSSAGVFIRNGSDITQPPANAWTLNCMRRCGGMPRVLYSQDCCLTAFRVSGKCTELDNLYSGAEWDFIEVFSQGKPTGNSALGDGSNTGTDAIIDTKPYEGDIYAISPAAVSLLTGTAATSAHADTLYYGKPCNDCGDGDTETDWIAKLVWGAGNTKSLWYSTDGGATFTEVVLNPLNINHVSIDKVGNDVFVTYQVTNTVGGTIKIEVDQQGQMTLGTDTSRFQLVNQPTDVYVNGSSIFWSGLEGYVYKAIGINATETIVHQATLTDSHLDRIHGCSDTIVAVGAELTGGGTLPFGVLYSHDNGASWAVATNPTGWGDAGFDLSSVWVHSKYVWYVGTTDGQLLKTCNGGLTWATVYTNAAGNPISDIVFPTNDAGYVATFGAGGSEIVYTITGGEQFALYSIGARVSGWSEQTSLYILTGASNSRYYLGNRLAFPDSTNLTKRANNLIATGSSTDNVGWCQSLAPTFA